MSSGSLIAEKPISFKAEVSFEELPASYSYSTFNNLAIIPRIF
jgi:hypothetical protein